MNEDLVKFNEYLTYIGDKLQKPAEFVYDLLLRQVYFEAAVTGVWLVVGITLCAFTPKVFRWARKHFDTHYDWDGTEFLIPIAMGVAGTILSLINLNTVLQIAINPHWYMIQLAASLVK